MDLDNLIIDFEDPSTKEGVYLSREETEGLLKFIAKEVKCKVKVKCYTGTIREEGVSYENNSFGEKSKTSDRFQDIKGEIVKEDLSLSFKGIRILRDASTKVKKASGKVCKWIRLEFDVNIPYGLLGPHRELELINDVRQGVNQYLKKLYSL